MTKALKTALDKVIAKGVQARETQDGYEIVVWYGVLQARCLNSRLLGKEQAEDIVYIGNRLLELHKLKEKLKSNYPFPVVSRVVPDGIYCNDACSFNRWEESFKCCELFNVGLLKGSDKDLRCEECLKKQVEWESK
jgi:hypothetical protein